MIIEIDDVRAAMAKEPNLGYGGFYPNPDDKLAHDSLVTKLAEVQTCCDWLDVQIIGRRVGCRSLQSYTLKHACEFGTGQYCSNGSFLIACVILGVPYKHNGGKNPNARVAVKHYRGNRCLHGDRARNAPLYAEFTPILPHRKGKVERYDINRPVASI
jgi:hypothetical protein